MLHALPISAVLILSQTTAIFHGYEMLWIASSKSKCATNEGCGVKQYSGVTVIVNVCYWKVIQGTPFMSQSDIPYKGESVVPLVELNDFKVYFCFCFVITGNNCHPRGM
jgi:hypothetical protein